MNYYIVIALTFSSVIEINSKNLPDSINTCKLKDPNLDECFRTSAQDAIRILKNGLPNLGISSIDPLDIETIDIPSTTGPVSLKQLYKNIKISGLAKSKYDQFKVNPDTLNMYIDSTCDITMEGDYEISGQILVVAVNGAGKFKMTLQKLRSLSNITADIYTKKGRSYLKFRDYKLTNNPVKVEMWFDNLFGGNQLLGDEMNKFLNEHWKDIYGEMKSPFEEAFALIFQQLSNHIFSKIPLEEMFPSDKERFAVNT